MKTGILQLPGFSFFFLIATEANFTELFCYIGESLQTLGLLCERFKFKPMEIAHLVHMPKTFSGFWV